MGNGIIWCQKMDMVSKKCESKVYCICWPANNYEQDNSSWCIKSQLLLIKKIVAECGWKLCYESHCGVSESAVAQIDTKITLMR